MKEIQKGVYSWIAETNPWACKATMEEKTAQVNKIKCSGEGNWVLLLIPMASHHGAVYLETMQLGVVVGDNQRLKSTNEMN